MSVVVSLFMISTLFVALWTIGVTIRGAFPKILDALEGVPAASVAPPRMAEVIVLRPLGATALPRRLAA